MNRSFFKKFEETENDAMDEQFIDYCVKLASKLRLRYGSNKRTNYGIYDFLDTVNIDTNKRPIRLLIEKYVIHKIYNGKLNHKFNYKYTASNESKLRKLHNIRKTLNSSRNINTKNLNDPDWYNVSDAFGMNFESYKNNVNYRINKYSK